MTGRITGLARNSALQRVLALAMVVAVLAGCAAPMGSSSPQAAPMTSAEMSAAPMSGAAQDFIAQSDGNAGIPGDSTSALLNRLLIARASMDMVVQDTAATLAAIETLLQEDGGYISNANFYSDSAGDPSQQYGNLTLRVPAENLDATLDALAALAIRVRSRNISREDITDQYTDNDARLRTLRATEDELLAMLEEVRERPNATPDDILAVHNRLMEIRGQIEQVQGQKNMYDNLVALSTIDLQIAPDSAAAPIVEEGWQPGSVLRNASRALVNALQGLGDFLIWFVVFALPLILIAIVPLVLFFLFVRWLFRLGSRKDKAAAPVAAAPITSTHPAPPPSDEGNP